MYSTTYDWIFFKGMFTNIVARWPGSTHDSFVFSNSHIGQKLESQPHSIEDGLLLGDSGYPCKPYLMTPYLNPTTAKEEAYNKAHTGTRVAIEQAFGWWKRRFHLLHSEVRMEPEKTCQLIGACAVLHNIAFCFFQMSSITTQTVQKPHISSVTVDLNCKNNYR